MGAFAESPVMAQIENGAWMLVGFLNPTQRTELRNELAALSQKGTALSSVAFIRLADVGRGSGAPNGAFTPISPISSVLSLIGIDPLSGLSPS